MTATDSLEVRYVEANGIRFAYLEMGQGPLVLCLHGFPDTAWGFAGLLPVLAAQGYRVVAPFLRGYAPTELAPDGDYSLVTISKDVLALIEALGETHASLIGHDWGGYAAYGAANLNPRRIRRLAVLSVPHMGASRFSLSQLRKSWYILLFQLPWLPEYLVPQKNFAFIDRLYRDWSPLWSAYDYDLTPVKKALAAPGGLKAALAYYRGAIRGATADMRRLMQMPVTVPTLQIAGDLDGAIDPRQFQDAHKGFTGGLDLHVLPRLGHFPHREDLQQVAPLLLAHLAS